VLLPSQCDEFYHVFNNILTQLTSCVLNNVEVERPVTNFLSIHGSKKKKAAKAAKDKDFNSVD
jgi:hypothetical protein